MRIQWASYKRVKESAEELKGLIRAKYPDAEFKLVRAPDQVRSWHLLALVDVDDLEEVTALTNERAGDMLSEEHIPIHVIPIEAREQALKRRPTEIRRTG
jgi:hypothetical protein